MRMRWWMALFVASIFALTCNAARAQDKDHGNGHGHAYGHYKNHHDEDGDRGWYSQHDRDDMYSWYHEHEDHDDLPPGLAKRDRLPPGLERQLVLRGELPPGLRRRIRPVPVELERELPPPPRDCEHVVIGGHIVLWNRHTNIVLDIFHFERDNENDQGEQD